MIPHTGCTLESVPLILTIQQVIVVLHRGEWSEAILLCANLHVMELITVHGRCADGSYLARLDQRVQGLHSFLDRVVEVEAMNLIEVKIVGVI